LNFSQKTGHFTIEKQTDVQGISQWSALGKGLEKTGHGTRAKRAVYEWVEITRKSQKTSIEFKNILLLS